MPPSEITIDFAQVADLYDAYANTDFDIPFYLGFCRRYRQILELMCGTGRVSLPLIREGYDLTCVDYSWEMLEVFRAKLPPGAKTELICQDVSQLDLGKQFDLVMIPFHSLAEITDREKRKQAVRKIYLHLPPRGTFFCTLYNPDYRKKTADGSERRLGEYTLDGGRKLTVKYVNTYAEAEGNIIGRQLYEIYNKDGQLHEKRVMPICFSLISREEMTETAREAGFTLKEIYGDYEGNPYREDSMFMNFVFVK